MKYKIGCFAAALLLSGCHHWEGLTNTQKGAIIGGGTGAVVGSEVGDGAGGALLGGAAGALGGGAIGNQIDKRDHRDYRRGRYNDDYYRRY